METKEREFKGLVINGFVALILLLVLTALSIYGIVYFAKLSQTIGVVLCVVVAVMFLILLSGLRMQEPNEAMAMLFFGKYCGTFKKTGFYWVNFLLTSKRVSLRARNLNVDPIKVNDKTGNPILIGQILVWKLKDTYKAMFEIDSQTMAGGTRPCELVRAKRRVRGGGRCLRLRKVYAFTYYRRSGCCYGRQGVY